MRLMKRNLRPIWYCLYSKKTPVYDEDGYETGEGEFSYELPVKMLCNVSHATGTAQQEIFGTLESYDKVIITDDMNCPITENTVIFIDNEPEYSYKYEEITSDDTTVKVRTKVVSSPYEYVVKRVAKSLNHISYGVSKVTVS